MWPLQWLALGAYRAIAYALLPWLLLQLCWNGLRDHAYLKRLPERFGFVAARRVRCAVWVHAVSVGEVQAAVPLVRGLQQRWPQLRILLTTTTPSGSDAVRRLFGESVAHVYAPYDYPGALARFLAAAQPGLLVLMETELWPNLIAACAQRRIHAVLMNARLSERSRRGYARVRPLTEGMLAALTVIAAQTDDDAQRLRSLGASRHAVSVTGNLKFDVELQPSVFEEAQAMRRNLGSEREVWVAASTHEGEEEQVLRAHARVVAQRRRALLVLVPRHTVRAARVGELCRRHGFVVAARSERERLGEEVQVLLVDTMGELPVFLAAAETAFVGGSLVPVGGHNVLEPAALGLPVLSGPHVFNFAEIVRRLTQAGGLVTVGSCEELALAVSRLLADATQRQIVGERARRFVEGNRGATERALALLAPLLPASGSA